MLPPPPPGQPRNPTTPGPGQGPHPSYPTAASPSGFGTGPIPQPGGFVGPYRIVRELAAGGMGIVYVAQHPSLNRQVALKLMRAGAGPNEVERFRIEAQASARLNHPHIVAVHDVGIAGGQPYLVMDLIQGRSLKDVIRDDGPMDPLEAASVIAKLARAMSYAHTRSILHRDIKPHNVLIDGEGEPLLTDFGLAKDVSTQDQGLTVSGQVVGTPAYMPPEQAEGELDRVDRRADIYSLGATLYEMLVGEPAFSGATTANVLFQVLTKEPVAPRKHDPAIDRDLETICLKCLEKEPEARYLTAQALADDLERYLDDEPIEARPIGLLGRLSRKARRNRRTVQVVTLLLAGALVAGFLQAQQTARAAQRAAEASQRAAEASQRAGDEAEKRAQKEVELQQVNKRIGVLAKARAELERGYGLMAQGRVDDALEMFVRAATIVNSISESAGDEGRMLIGASRRGAEVGIGTLGREIRLAQDPRRDGHTAVAWGGERVAYAFTRGNDGTRVSIVEAKSGARLLAFSSSFVTPLALQFSPDGASLAGVFIDRNKQAGELRVVDARTGELRWPPRPLQHARREGVLRFSPDGSLLLVPGSDPLLLDARTGKPVHLLHSDKRKPGYRSNACSSSFMPKTRWLAIGYDDGTVGVWDVRSGHAAIPFLGVHPVKWLGSVNAVVFVPSEAWGGSNLITGGADGSVKLWSVLALLPDGGRRQFGARPPSHVPTGVLFPGGAGGVDRFSHSRDRSVVVMGFQDGRVRLFEQVKRMTQILEVGHSTVHGVSMHPSGNRLVTGHQGMVDVWDTRLVSKRQTNQGMGGLVAFGSRGRLVVTGQSHPQLGSDRYLAVIDLVQRTSRRIPFTFHNTRFQALARLTGLAVTPDNRYAVLSANCDQAPRDNWIRVFDLASGRLVKEVRQDHAATLAVAPDGASVYVGRRTGGRAPSRLKYLCQVQERSLPSLEPRGSYVWHVAGITSISARGWLTTGSEDGTVAVWKPGSASPERVLLPGRTTQTGRALTPLPGDATLSPDRARSRWRTSLDPSGDRRIPGRARYASAGVYACDVSPSGDQVLTGSANGALRWWSRTSSTQASRVVTCGQGRVLLARFATPELIVTASGNEVRVWDAVEGRALRVLRTRNPIISASISPDGRWVAASLLNGIVQVWSIGTVPLQGFEADPAGTVNRARLRR